MRRFLMALLLTLGACVAPSITPSPTPAFPVARVADRFTISTVREVDVQGLRVGTMSPPYYALRAVNGRVCLVTQRIWTQTQIGDMASCYWQATH